MGTIEQPVSQIYLIQPSFGFLAFVFFKDQDSSPQDCAETYKSISLFPTF